jgi:hypothetical protein
LRERRSFRGSHFESETIIDEMAWWISNNLKKKRRMISLSIKERNSLAWEDCSLAWYLIRDPAHKKWPWHGPTCVKEESQECTITNGLVGIKSPWWQHPETSFTINAVQRRSCIVFKCVAYSAPAHFFNSSVGLCS